MKTSPEPLLFDVVFAIILGVLVILAVLIVFMGCSSATATSPTSCTDYAVQDVGRSRVATTDSSTCPDGTRPFLVRLDWVSDGECIELTKSILDTVGAGSPHNVVVTMGCWKDSASASPKVSSP